MAGQGIQEHWNLLYTPANEIDSAILHITWGSS